LQKHDARVTPPQGEVEYVGMEPDPEPRAARSRIASVWHPGFPIAFEALRECVRVAVSAALAHAVAAGDGVPGRFGPRDRRLIGSSPREAASHST
jgi:hypothetical protein